MNHSIVIRNVRISYWYFALLFLSCLFLSIRLVFNPTVSNSTDGFLYLIWNGPLSQVAIVISCISILYVDSKITGVLKSNLKANLISCCFAGAVLLLPICIVYLISLVLFPAPIIGYIPVSIRGTIWAEVYTLGNGKLMVLLIALLAFLGGCLWASVALTIAKALDKKIYGVLFAIILYHVINSLFIGTEMPFLAPHNLWFPTLASNIPIYIIALVQIVAIAMTIGILATWSQTRIGHHAQSNKANPKTFALIIAVAAIVYSVICIYPVFKAAATYGYGINVLEPICFLFSTEKSILILNTCCVAFVLIVLKEHDKTNCFVYILFCVVIFYFVLLIVLCILFISMGFISNDWSQFAYYYTHTSLSNYVNYFQITFMPSYIAAFQPVGFLLTSTGLIMVFSLLCAVIIRVADDLLAFEDGIVVVLLLQEIWVTMCQLSIYIQFLSPFAHAIIGNHSFGYDYKPTITTSFYVLFSQIVFALLFDYIITVRKKIALLVGEEKNKEDKEDKMKKSVVFVLTLILALGTLTSIAYARDIERVDGAVYSTGWSTTPYMYKYNAHSDPAIVFIESLTGSVTANMFNTASESCLGDQAFSSRERRECAWQGSHGQPGYRYFAGVIAPAYRQITSSFSPDSY